MKQDVAVKDKRGDLSLKMQGLKDAPKANEPAKSDAKTDNGDVLKKLQDAAKDADIKAEAAKANESAVEEAPKPEKPYIPETAANDDTDANLLDGNGSNAFKTARFASSGSGSAGYERSNAGKAQSGNKSGTKSVSGTKASAPSATTAESGVKSAATTSETASSGEVKTTKSGDKTGKNQGGDGSTTETGKGTLSDNNNSESNGETKNSSNNSGKTRPETGNVVTPMRDVEETISTVAAPRQEEPWELEKESSPAGRNSKPRKKSGECGKKSATVSNEIFCRNYEMPSKRKPMSTSIGWFRPPTAEGAALRRTMSYDSRHSRPCAPNASRWISILT